MSLLNLVETFTVLLVVALCIGLPLFKLNNRWAWGMVPTRRVEPRVQLSRKHSVSMTTLWAATTHPAPSHWKTVETLILTTYLPWQKGKGGPGIKRWANYPKAITNVEWLDIRSYTVSHVGAPAQTPQPPRTKTLRDTAGEHCFVFNLA